LRDLYPEKSGREKSGTEKSKDHTGPVMFNQEALKSRNDDSQNNNSLGDTLFRERRSGVFQRSITLPEPVKQNEMDTRIDNGALTVVIPREK